MDGCRITTRTFESAEAYVISKENRGSLVLKKGKASETVASTERTLPAVGTCGRSPCAPDVGIKRIRDVASGREVRVWAMIKLPDTRWLARMDADGSKSRSWTDRDVWASWCPRPSTCNLASNVKLKCSPFGPVLDGPKVTASPSALWSAATMIRIGWFSARICKNIVCCRCCWAVLPRVGRA